MHKPEPRDEKLKAQVTHWNERIEALETKLVRKEPVQPGLNRKIVAKFHKKRRKARTRWGDTSSR